MVPSNKASQEMIFFLNADADKSKVSPIMMLGGGHPASDSCLEQGPGAQCSVAPVHRVPPPGGHTLHSISTQPGGWDGHIPTHCLHSVRILTIFEHYDNPASQKEYMVKA